MKVGRGAHSAMSSWASTGRSPEFLLPKDASAAPYFRKAIETAPDQIAGYGNLSALLMQQNKTAEAEADARASGRVYIASKKTDEEAQKVRPET